MDLAKFGPSGPGHEVDLSSDLGEVDLVVRWLWAEFGKYYVLQRWFMQGGFDYWPFPSRNEKFSPKITLSV